jgi:hypothetical protein
MAGVQFAARAPRSFQTDSVAHPASYPMGTRGSIPGGEADLSPSSAEVKNSGAIPPLYHTSSWRGAQLFNHIDNVTFLV